MALANSKEGCGASIVLLSCPQLDEGGCAFIFLYQWSLHVGWLGSLGAKALRRIWQMNALCQQCSLQLRQKVLLGRRPGRHTTVSTKLCDSSPGGLGYSCLLCVSFSWWLWHRLLSIHQISIPDIPVMISGLEYIISLSSSFVGVVIGFGRWDVNIDVCGNPGKALWKFWWLSFLPLSFHQQWCGPVRWALAAILDETVSLKIEAMYQQCGSEQEVTWHPDDSGATRSHLNWRLWTSFYERNKRLSCLNHYYPTFCFIAKFDPSRFKSQLLMGISYN